MNIGILPVDSNYPNLALMKISSFHKSIGDHVEMYNQLCRYDKVYASKIFNFTPDSLYFINSDQIERGGTGYYINKKLPEEIDKLQPDYSLYPINENIAYGFLTRGCPNKCKWCIVPEKEGKVTPYMDVEEIAIDGRDHLILMDNNILASDYGLCQLEKIANKKYHVDFNQGLDARLVNKDIALLLSKIKWIKRIRFGCDTPSQIISVEKAMKLLDSFGFKGEYFLYCILLDFEESVNRVCHFRNNKRVIIHAQPFRSIIKKQNQIPQWQKDLAHWCDRKEIYRSCEFKDFSPRRGFVCKEYFNIKQS